VPALDHRREIACGRRHRASLRDVVDPALDDQDVRAVGGLVEARQDLLGSLAVDAVVREVELRMAQRRPVLPLPARVAGKRA